MDRIKIDRRSRNKLTIIGCGVLLLISACICSKNASGVLETDTPVARMPTSSKVTVMPTATSSPSVISTGLPSLTSTFSPTPIFTLTPATTSTPTLVPIPTLGNSERDIFIRDQMITNGNCSPPCFWGLTPGESPWQDARALLYHLGLKVKGGPYHLGETAGSYRAIINPEQPSTSQSEIGFIVREDGIIQLIDFASDLNQAPYYSVRNIMNIMGTPAYVGVDLQIGGWGELPDVAPIIIVIAYEEDRQTPWLERPWALFYYYDSAYKVGDKYRFCVANLGGDAEWPPDGLVLSLQSPQSAVTVDELAAMAGKPHFSEPPYIEEATGTNVQEFYDLMLRSDESPCFDTPIDFWP